MVAHLFEIRQNNKRAFVTYFQHNQETMFWAEGYSSKSGAKSAIESIQKNGPGAEIRDAE